MFVTKWESLEIISHQIIAGPLGKPLSKQVESSTPFFGPKPTNLKSQALFLPYLLNYTFRYRAQ